jgi:hypothetical protein
MPVVHVFWIFLKLDDRVIILLYTFRWPHPVTSISVKA